MIALADLKLGTATLPAPSPATALPSANAPAGSFGAPTSEPVNPTTYPPAGMQFLQSSPTVTKPIETQEETAKRKRRTKAEMEAARAGEGHAPAMAQFRGQVAAAELAHKQAMADASAPQAQFGIVQNAPAPDDALGAAIANAFNLPMN